MLAKIQSQNSKLKLLVIVISIVFLFINSRSSNLNFVMHGLGMIPLAYMLGELTSSLSEFIGEKKGGLLTATLGNIPEITMSIWSMKLGLIPMVQGALIGVIINNMLLVLGVSILLGGIKYKEQTFNRNIAKMNFNILLLALSSIVIIGCIDNYANIDQVAISKISNIAAVILIVMYILSLIFSMYTHGNLFATSTSVQKGYSENKREILWIIVKIVVSVICINFASEKLIGDVNIFIDRYNVSQTFMGIILIPLLGSIGENLSAILCAIRNKVNLSLEIAVGSSVQIALFATPLLVIIGGFMGVGITMVFSIVHIIIIGLAILMAYIVFQDGKTYWFEGCILISIYIITTICYFYVV